MDCLRVKNILITPSFFIQTDIKIQNISLHCHFQWLKTAIVFLIPTTYCIGHLLILNWVTMKPLTNVSMCESWISVVSNIFTPVLDCLLINHKLSVILLHFIKSFMTGIKNIHCQKKKILEYNCFYETRSFMPFCYIILLHVVNMKHALWIMYD